MDPVRNIILISLDALRAGQLSTYGYGRETTPYLDRFAEGGVKFTEAYSASSHTRESVPALLAGQYPSSAVDGSFHRDARTIPDRLDEAGYRSGAFHSNPFVSRAYGFEKGFDTFDDDLYLGGNKLVALAQRALDKLRNQHYARATEINDRSLNWLDTLDDDPFFLWNHYMDTHGPYEAPAEYQREFHGEVVSDKTAQKLYQRAIDDPDSITEDEQRLLVDLYDAEISYTDSRLETFFEQLEDRGLLEKSLVVITADHGDAFGEHGYYEHPRQLHDELVHVPLLVSGPGVEPATVDTPVSTLDIATTVFEAVGEESESLPGIDLRAVASTPGAFEGRTVISQTRGESEDAHLWRVSARNSSSTILSEYDTETGSLSLDDTTDATDTAARKLRTHVEERIAGEDHQTDRSPENVDEAIEDRLSALGYK